MRVVRQQRESRWAQVHGRQWVVMRGQTGAQMAGSKVGAGVATLLSAGDSSWAAMRVQMWVDVVKGFARPCAHPRSQ